MSNQYIQLTDNLDIPEIKITDASYDGIFHILEAVPAQRTRICPSCGCPGIKQLNGFTRTFWDVAPIGDGEIIRISYSFHRYKCLNHKCGHVFTDSMAFARPRCQVTLRFERFVFNYLLSLENHSFGDVSALTGHLLSRQAIHKIFYRYMKESIKENPGFLQMYEKQHYQDVSLNILWQDIKKKRHYKKGHAVSLF